MNNWQKQVKQALINNMAMDEDSRIVAHKNGTISMRQNYFYRHGRTPEKWAKQIKNALLVLGYSIKIVSAEDRYNSWPKDSYFKVVIAEN